jgi:hypothetical protein
MVIEGNVPMGFELSEIPTNIPLGGGPLGEAILEYAARGSVDTLPGKEARR